MDKLGVQFRSGSKIDIEISSLDLCHCIQFHETIILARKSKFLEHFIREVIVIELHLDNINREVFSLSRSWKF